MFLPGGGWGARPPSATMRAINGVVFISCAAVALANGSIGYGILALFSLVMVFVG